MAENYEPVLSTLQKILIWTFKIDFGCPREGFDLFTQFDF